MERFGIALNFFAAGMCTSNFIRYFRETDTETAIFLGLLVAINLYIGIVKIRDFKG